MMGDVLDDPPDWIVLDESMFTLRHAWRAGSHLPEIDCREVFGRFEPCPVRGATWEQFIAAAKADMQPTFNWRDYVGDTEFKYRIDRAGWPYLDCTYIGESRFIIKDTPL